MSKLPELLRARADGLMKEAQEQAHSAEVAFHTAIELVKRAEEVQDNPHEERRHQAMLAMAERQAKAAETAGLHSAIQSRLSTITPEELHTLKAKISAMEGHTAAYNSAREDAPQSTFLRSGVGGVLGGVAGHMLGGNPLVGGLIGAGVGGISALIGKGRYAERHLTDPSHFSVGEAKRDSRFESLDRPGVGRAMVEAGRYSNDPYAVDDEYEHHTPSALFYKKACVESLQQLCDEGLLDIEVAEAAAQEVSRRLA